MSTSIYDNEMYDLNREELGKELRCVDDLLKYDTNPVTLSFAGIEIIFDFDNNELNIIV